MKKLIEVLSTGLPRFDDPALAAVARLEGAAAAWQKALLRSPAEAARAARGHFAVGLRDEGGSTFLAVDRFATHTLCYRDEDSSLRFSARADALAHDAADIDTQALFDYLYFHAIPSPRTVYRGVKRLPPGHFVWHENGSTRVARYWKPTFDETPTQLATAKRQFLALLRQAVATQLDESQPACFLSGGTDSSTVAGLIREVTGKAPATYSIGFEAEGYDEMEYARIAARRFGTEHHEIYITPADLVRHIPELAAHHDQPFGNSSALPAYYCALRARQDGVTRLLAGDGGDELFGGNTRYAKQRVFSWYDELPSGLRSAVIDPFTDRGMLDRLPLLRKGASYVRQARVPMPDRLQTYNLLHRLGQTAVLTPGFLASVDAAGPQAQERAVWQESQGASFVNRMLAYDWRYTLAENDLPKVRGSAELAGVSVGYPFLDQAIVEFSERLPTAYKLKSLKLRWFFKEALRGFLPDEIITKKKHGFGLPFGVWATQNDGLKSLASDSLRGLGERGIVRREFITTLLDRHLPEHPGYYGELVWILMMLEQWFRHHAPGYRLDG
jgi:asparagine synthase (glutamine-hydrolysing)